MGRKFIAALLVMLVSGMTGFAAAVILSPTQAAATQTRQSDDVAHSCCHRSLQFDIAPPPMPLTMPCGKQHSCCWQPSQGNSSSLPSASRTERRDATGITRMTDSPHNAKLNAGVRLALVPGFWVYEVLSTVLRI